MKVLTRLDYVKLYAQKLKQNNNLFKQQKLLIESQMKGSTSLFRNFLGKGHFKEHAREYLRNVGILIHPGKKHLREF